MNGGKFGLTIGVAFLVCLVSAGGVNAALVKTDLLGGLGDFEFSADTTWQEVTGTGWPTGVKPSTSDDSVAAGWGRLTSLGVVTGQNAFYRIVPGMGVNASNCQYFSLRGTTRPVSSAYIQMQLAIDDDKPFKIHHGDELTFRLDKVFMSDYAGLPNGAWVKYLLMFRWILIDGGSTYSTLELKPSSTPGPVELTAPVPPNTAQVLIWLEIRSGGDIGSNEPGIYVDGAHLFRKSAGNINYDMERIPAPRNRNIKTQMIFFEKDVDDPYQVARDYDSAMLTFESDYPSALRLKYCNPNIKVYLYENSGLINDWRKPDGTDPVYNNCPIPFGHVITDHLDWLYAWPSGYIQVPDNREPWRRDVNCFFIPDGPNVYYIHMEDPDFQNEWQIAARDKAIRYRLDGIFVDGLEAYTIASDPPYSEPYSQPQSFVHSICPYIRQANIDIAVNNAIGNLNAAPEAIWFDPSWKTSSTYPVSAGYQDNNGESTPDVFFQEWAFFKHYAVGGIDANRYDLNYWNSCLSNMDAIKRWNRTLPDALKKNASMSSYGLDMPNDPVGGLDGWAHFALCSYLLGQNDHTSFGVNIRYPVDGRIDMDLNFTKRLGTPSTDRYVMNADKSLQIRFYTNGIVVVNGHPTQSRSYRSMFKMLDENNRTVPAFSLVTFKPHTGRVYFYR